MPGQGGGVSAEDLDARLATAASLAEPVRRALYRYVVGQPEPVSRDQAAQGVGVARHVAKFHLERLVTDGLLDVGYRRPPGRDGPGAGRPAKVYRRSARQVDVTLPERRYELAGHLLAQAVNDAEHEGVPVSEALHRAAAETGRTRGEEARRRVGSRPSHTTVMAATAEVLEDCGFQPRTDPDGVSLTNCPFHTLARDYTDLVCRMNLALVDGLLAGLRVKRLEATLDPEPTRCCVRLVERPTATEALDAQ
jgi:predicted ArsR family transcriptional regulator